MVVVAVVLAVVMVVVAMVVEMVVVAQQLSLASASALRGASQCRWGRTVGR